MTATSSQRLNLRPTCALDADELEPARWRAAPARRALDGLDAGDDGVEPRRRGDVQQALEQQRADALAAAVAGRRRPSPRRWSR